MNYIKVAFLFLVSGELLQAQVSSDSIITLDAVNVEAYQISTTLRSLPGSLSVLTGQDIKGSDQVSIYQTLNVLPGVNMQSGTFTTNRIMIRGMGSRTPYNTNRIRFYLNDIPLTSSDGLSSPEEYEPENIGRIEVIKGPSSALYGSGLGGSINFFTPRYSQNLTRVNAQYGSFNTMKFSIPFYFGNERYDTYSNIVHLHSDGWRQNSEYRRTSIITANNLYRKYWRVSFLLLLTGVNSGIPSSLGKTVFENNPQLAAANWNAIKGYKKYFRGAAGISIANTLSDKFTNKLILFGKGTDSYERRPFNNLDDASLAVGLRDKITLHVRNAEILAGLELIKEKYSWKLDTGNHMINHNNENRRLLNIFSNVYYRPNKVFNISLAVALNSVSYKLNDLFPQNGDQSGRKYFLLIFSPRIGFNFSSSEHFALYASAGHGFSMPSPEETLFPEGNINTHLKHEQGWQFETGTRFTVFRNRLKADVSWYVILLKDLLVTKRISEDVFTGINAGRTNHAGVEIQAISQIMKCRNFPGSVEILLSYSGSVNRFIDFSDNGQSFNGKKLPGIPSQLMIIQSVWKPIKALEFVFDIRYTGSEFLNDANSLSYGSFYLMNIRLSAEISIGKNTVMNIYSGINNLSGRNYASMLIVNAIANGINEPRYYYPGLPRNGFAGISISL